MSHGMLSNRCWGVGWHSGYLDATGTSCLRVCRQQGAFRLTSGKTQLVAGTFDALVTSRQVHEVLKAIPARWQTQMWSLWC